MHDAVSNCDACPATNVQGKMLEHNETPVLFFCTKCFNESGIKEEK